MSYKLLYSDFIAFGVSVDVDPSVDGDQSVDVDQSVGGDQSDDGGQSDDEDQSVDGDQSSSQAWDYIMQLTLTQSSFYRNLDFTNQMELLSILNNKQSSEDDMIKEIEEWYKKQPPQIQVYF
uniref:Uncharacterized protein n=1 Tax=Acrobeloides nanus TaxID=290746 RepID=A0A914E2K3_9BILA